MLELQLLIDQQDRTLGFVGISLTGSFHFTKHEETSSPLKKEKMKC
jgi:hypothetical protein